MLTPGRMLVGGGQCGGAHEIKTLELISVRTNWCRGLQAWMTDAKGVELFCKGIVGGGQYTGGGQEQPEQERPEQRVAPKPTNRTMLHHHHAAFPVSRFERETATTPQSIRNNNHKTMSINMFHFIPVLLFGFFLSGSCGEPNETTLRHILPNIYYCPYNCLFQ